MNHRDPVLTPNEIVTLVPRNLILRMLRGVMAEDGLTIGVMLDVDEAGYERSRGTGKVWIWDDTWTGQAAYCRYLRSWPARAVGTRCGRCDRNWFERARERAAQDPQYRGEIDTCSAGGLRSFLVPIVERETNTFVGVVLGGQKRSRQTLFGALKYMRDFVSRSENEALRRVPFWKLFWYYLKVQQVSSQDLERLKSKCEALADEIATPYALYARNKQAEAETRVQRDVMNMVSKSLSRGDGMTPLFEFMGNVMSRLQSWLLFDWSLVLELRETGDDAPALEITQVTGRGVGPHAALRGRRLCLAPCELIETRTVAPKAGFLRRLVDTLVPGYPDYQWVPFVTGDGAVPGGIVLGSAPTHPKTEYDMQRIRERMNRLKVICDVIAGKYSEMSALESERRRSAELQQKQNELRESIGLLENTVLGLTHQSRRPLVMMRAALSNVRDLHGRVAWPRLVEHIELGILASKHAEMLNRGITRVFADRMGRRFEYERTPIDARIKLRELCKTMMRLSGREDVSFAYFEESPMIEMNPDSFLYVFYVLSDNAIKYSYPGHTIELVCDEERDTARHALKVKSYGLPIEEPGAVFQKFRRGRNAHQVDESGIGFGCWAAREHMRRSGGDITVETDGNLSVFIVHLP
jgi:signal transduction histidine kinase